MDGMGNYRDVTADYWLSRLADGRTQLELRWRRRPKVAGMKQLTKAQREADTLRAWKKFGRAMERDYQRTRSRQG